jgi:hypothetical protein
MGNYCSSSQKDKENNSEKSEEWVLHLKLTFFFIFVFLIYFGLDTFISQTYEYQIYFDRRVDHED